MEKLVHIINEKMTDWIKNRDNIQTYELSADFTYEFLGLILPEIIIKSNFYERPVERHIKYSTYDADTLYLQRELNTMDLSIWESKSGFKGKNTNNWKYHLLLEHENYGQTWLQELQKLASTRAKHKLIITYGKGTTKGVKNKGADLLGEAKEIMDHLYENEYKENDGELYVMFGEELSTLGKPSDWGDGMSLYDIYHYRRIDEVVWDFVKL